MKLHLTLFTFILISINSVFSQNNNLQFNRALMETYTGYDLTNNTQSIIATIIVPTGKVWKIESTSLTTPQSWGQYLDQQYDNNIAFIGNFHFSNKYPHTTWLPAGSYNLTFYCTATQNGVIRNFSISGIEFNLVP